MAKRPRKVSKPKPSPTDPVRRTAKEVVSGAKELGRQGAAAARRVKSDFEKIKRSVKP